jgi:hypothetical protein
LEHSAGLTKWEHCVKEFWTVNIDGLAIAVAASSLLFSFAVDSIFMLLLGEVDEKFLFVVIPFVAVLVDGVHLSFGSSNTNNTTKMSATN